MKCIAYLLGLFCSVSALAAEGMVVHFTVKKVSDGSVSTYTNGVLMRLNEATTQAFPKQYEMRLESKVPSEGKVNLIITLKDISGAKPVYAGSGALTLTVGDSQTLELHQLASSPARYEVRIDTAYGQLPVTAH